ncbi:SRPBCC family protein [Streptomyces aculeolatus]
MQMQHHFSVPIAADEAWKVLLDAERIAPCMPGASLDSVDGDSFTGRVKVKVGPVGLTYKGTAEIVHRDEATHTAVLRAKGRDSRGNGTAAATVTMTLAEEGVGGGTGKGTGEGAGARTGVDVLTELDVTGRPAQLGRNLMADVAGRIIGQFAAALAEQLQREQGASAHPLPAGRNAAEDSDGPEAPLPTPAAAAAAGGGAAPAGSAAPRTPATNPAAATAASPVRAAGPAPAAAARQGAPDTVQVLGLAGGSVLRILAASLRAALSGTAAFVRRLLTRAARRLRA